MTIRVQEADFDFGAEIAALRIGQPRVGAVVGFVGAVRDLNDGAAVDSLELEHYPGMTERALEQIVERARARWALAGVTVIHRVGPLAPTDQIVMVAAASAHRGDAFAACEFIMDYLKTEAPFWKKEGVGETRRWVDARVSDAQARARWGEAGPSADAAVSAAPIGPRTVEK
ncbi:molybdopterin synthase catalytic subunit MoaE [Robbsia sp. Bb-Pol-6]|uniref:Molybdopterin synthase catalytic subunit n=1 Tax=Robbsia betulipollinis TaxID=2981849 RepID=A0ABT3ZIZ8_9BURK|nr:molybdopterin synthase catalytic subunit MoaE [Robbsia betulipollinis]MCY0386342.1 molybdopterin synthase catalytic subunit MoaE [Robbsia betulipollinis]